MKTASTIFPCRQSTAQREQLATYAENYHLPKAEIARRALTRWNTRGRVATLEFQDVATRLDQPTGLQVPREMVDGLTSKEVAGIIAWYLHDQPEQPSVKPFVAPTDVPYKTEKVH